MSFGVFLFGTSVLAVGGLDGCEILLVLYSSLLMSWMAFVASVVALELSISLLNVGVSNAPLIAFRQNLSWVS